MNRISIIIPMLNEAERIGKLLQHLIENAKQKNQLEKIETKNGFSDQDAQQFSFIKALTVFGYFTSEAGATQTLAYQAVPGGFKGSIPANQGTKSWGSLDYY